MARRRLAGVQVGWPDEETTGGFGKDAFEAYLKALRPRQGFRNLRDLIVVGDNDIDPSKSFPNIQKALSAAGYPVPEAPWSTAGGQALRVSVVMLPGKDEPGNLDTYLLRAVDKHPLNPCFAAYWECCRTGELPVTKASKVKLTTIVAASCKENPSCSLVWVWSERGNPIDLDHPSFDSLVEFLGPFAAPA